MPSTTQWLSHRGFAAAAITMTLLAPFPALSQVRDLLQAIPVGHVTWTSNDAGPIDGTGSRSPFEIDQRQMAFGQIAISAIELYPGAPAANVVPCGNLALRVKRYQGYWLTGNANGGQTVLLYRGGLVADPARPYVGVFFGSGNRLEIRTFNRGVSYDQNGSLVPGDVINAWTAASITAPTNRISPEKNGLWAVTPNGTKSAWKTGASGC